MTKTPKEEIEDEEKPEFDLGNLVGLVFSFFWFYRKLIIGLIMLCALLFWVRHLIRSAPELDMTPVVREVPTYELPTAAIGAANGDSATDEKLASATVSELIERSLKLRADWGKVRAADAFVINSDRIKIAKQLMTKELTKNEKVFALTSYIESVTILDSLNLEAKMNIVGTKEAVAEIGRKYSDHPDPAVAAKANLSMVLAPAYELIATSDPKKMTQLQVEFSARKNKIFLHLGSAQRLANVLVYLDTKMKSVDVTKPICYEILKDYDLATDPAIKAIAASLRERLYFGDLELDTILARLNADESTTRENVQTFYERIASNPNCVEKYYDLAMTLGMVYRDLERKDDAKALLGWLNTITDQVTDEKLKASVKNKLQNYLETL